MVGKPNAFLYGMTKSDRIISDLVNALSSIEHATAKPLAAMYIRGMAQQAIANANAHRERNSDGYLVVKQS